MKRCTALTAKGNPCQAWAMHGRDLCAVHAKVNAGSGAPAGNQNATRHGFYRSILTADELADLVANADNDTIDDEIALTRVTLRRLMKYMQEGDAILNESVRLLSQQGNITHEQLMEILDAISSSAGLLKAIAPLIFTGTRTVANLIRNQKPSTGLADTINDVLDELEARYPAL